MSVPLVVCPWVALYIGRQWSLVVHLTTVSRGGSRQDWEIPLYSVRLAPMRLKTLPTSGITRKIFHGSTLNQVRFPDHPNGSRMPLRGPSRTEALPGSIWPSQVTVLSCSEANKPRTGAHLGGTTHLFPRSDPSIQERNLQSFKTLGASLVTLPAVPLLSLLLE